MFQNPLLKNIFSWQILCRDEDSVLMHTIIFFGFNCSFQNTIREHLKNFSNLFFFKGKHENLYLGISTIPGVEV